MTPEHTAERLETLEIRLMEQEAAVDALTRGQLDLTRAVEALTDRLQRLERQVRELTPPDSGTADGEPPPPHY